MARGTHKGGMISWIMWTGLFFGVAVSVDYFSTQNVLQGRWSLYVPEETRTHLQVLWQGDKTEVGQKDEGTTPGQKPRWAKRLGEIRQRVQVRGQQLLGDIGMITLVTVAEQIQVEIKGSRLVMGTEQARALNELIGQLSEQHRGTPIGCDNAELVPIYPLVRVTCTQGEQPLPLWYHLQAWTGTELVASPVGLGDTQLRQFVVTLKGGESLTTPVSIEEINAMRALLTLHLRRVDGLASASAAPTP